MRGRGGWQVSPSSGPADARQQDQVPSPMQGPEAGRSPYPGQQTRNLLPVGHSHLVSIPAPLQGSPCIFCEINLFTVLPLCSIIIILCCGLCCSKGEKIFLYENCSNFLLS